MLAAEKKSLRIVRLLLSKEADVNLRNKDGWTAFHIAARAGSVEILELLLAQDPNLKCNVINLTCILVLQIEHIQMF